MTLFGTRDMDPRPAIVLSYGGGTNSTAMIVGMRERGERPDAIVFADTGGEKPHTYEHVRQVSAWCESQGFPAILTVKGSQPRQIEDGSLENECLRLGALPSKAMGFSSCSDKWKIDPFNRWLRAWCAGMEAKPVKLVGFDADEPHRAARAPKEEPLCSRRYPLIEWDWGRDECIAAIARAGLAQPGKSACFFCPSSRKPEIMELRDRYPDLLARALEIERRAIQGEGQAPALRIAKGLGRGFSWAEFLAADAAQSKLFTDVGMPEVDCGCYDGD